MKTLIQQITATEVAAAPMVLRLVFAIVLFPHGAQLLTGWFGGPGFTNAMAMFNSFGLPSPIAFLVIIIEFFGSLLILFGLFTRIASVVTIILFLGMIFKVHLPVGFFMNWAGGLKGEGYEYHILAIGILLALTLAGAGKFSLDNLIHKRLKA